MKASDIRLKTTDEISGMLTDKRNEFMNLRFQVVMGQLPDTSRLKVARREIARLETILTERANAAGEGVA
jgi:large subunit ribosomal protein L29